MLPPIALARTPSPRGQQGLRGMGRGWKRRGGRKGEGREVALKDERGWGGEVRRRKGDEREGEEGLGKA